MPSSSDHPVVKSNGKATQAERSPSTFFFLAASLAALAVVVLGIFGGMRAVPPNSAV